MNYMKCQHCSEYSALKSEYLTFCDHCGKKFPVIYKEWLVQHPDGDLAAFGLEYGIAAEEYAARERRRDRKARFTPRKKTNLAVGTICFVIVLGISFLYGPYLMAFFREPKVSATLLEADQWRTFRGNHIRMQTPLSLKPESPEDRPNMRRKVFQAGGKADGIVIRMEETVYLSHSSIALEDAGKRAARDMETKTGVSRFSYQTQSLEIEGQPALLQRGLTCSVRLRQSHFKASYL